MIKKVLSLPLVALLLACTSPIPMGVNPADFRAEVDGKEVGLYTLTNEHGMTMQVTNYGARVVTLYVPDREGVFEDVVLGYESIDRYLNNPGTHSIGATMGRYANRIAWGRYTHGGVTHQLTTSRKGHCLHGGEKGFNRVVWMVDSVASDALYLSHFSPDGNEGFPGNLTVNMVYRLTPDNAFEIAYRATTDRATPINLTHHSFFNLKGEGNGAIADHLVTVNARYITPLSSDLVPTGELLPVAETPFDLTTPTVIGERVYDHNFVLDNDRGDSIALAATLYEPTSGRYMEVWTTEPGMQLYTPSFAQGRMVGKRGTPYDGRCALAFETQQFPDAPNHPHFPSAILEAGEVYNHVCIYKFGVRE